MMRLSHLCDRCFRMLGDNETMYGFKVFDDSNDERTFQGHKACVEEIQEILRQTYGMKEVKRDGGNSNQPAEDSAKEEGQA